MDIHTCPRQPDPMTPLDIGVYFCMSSRCVFMCLQSNMNMRRNSISTNMCLVKCVHVCMQFEFFLVPQTLAYLQSFWRLSVQIPSAYKVPYLGVPCPHPMTSQGTDVPGGYCSQDHRWLTRRGPCHSVSDGRLCPDSPQPSAASPRTSGPLPLQQHKLPDSGVCQCDGHSLCFSRERLPGSASVRRELRRYFTQVED